MILCKYIKKKHAFCSEKIFETFKHIFLALGFFRVDELSSSKSTGPILLKFNTLFLYMNNNKINSTALPAETYILMESFWFFDFRWSSDELCGSPQRDFIFRRLRRFAVNGLFVHNYSWKFHRTFFKCYFIMYKLYK